MSSCCYNQDKLVIVNKTNDTIFYGTYTFETVDEIYYSVAGGGEINPHGKSSPSTRGTIEFNMQDGNADGNLYMMYFSKKDIDGVFKDIDKAVKSGKFKVEKYTSKGLNKQNWVVTYSK